MYFGRKFFLSLLIALVCLYIAFAIYLKIMAREYIKEAISSIKGFYPQIANISYESTNFSPYDYLRDNIGINKISISFNNTDLTFNINNIKIHDFRNLEKNSFGSFNLSFDNFTVSSFADLYDALAIFSDNNLLYSQMGNIPDHLNLSMSGDFNYTADDQTLAMNLIERQNDNPIFTYQTTLSSLPLSRAFLSNPTIFLNTLNSTVTQRSHYQLNVDQTVSVADIISTSPLLGNFLQNLNYTTLPMHINATSDYQGGQNQETFYANADIQDVGSLNLSWTILFDTPPSPYNLASLLLDPEHPHFKSTSFMIQSANITYTDHSFMNRLFVYLSNVMHQPVSQIQDVMQNILTSYAAQTDIPEFSSISNELSNFIDNPGTLSFSLNPPTPFGFSDIAKFFAAQQRANMIMSKDLSKLSGAQRNLLFNRYEQATSQAYSNFFARIGLSVEANSAVDNNPAPAN